MAELDDVVIVGAGLAGLSCACYLSDKNIPFQILEASDSIGGRVRTDEVDGYLLDRGFQVFLTAYPEAEKLLDYEKLDLVAFEPGALVRHDGKFHKFSDPWRQPSAILATALSPIATLFDKLRVARFRNYTSRGSIEAIYRRVDHPTIEMLTDQGFSSTIIDRFFKPFLGGVFLDPSLQTSSRMCEFVFRMFSKGKAAIPASGMQEIPNQLASKLPDGSIKTEAAVDSIDKTTIRLVSGERIESSAVVLATPEPIAYKLLNNSGVVESQRVTNIYFTSPKAPLKEKILVLNGEGKGPVNNLSIPSEISPKYAPPSQSLISLTVIEDYSNIQQMIDDVLKQMHEWFGPQVNDWKHLKTYEIDYALPTMQPNNQEPLIKPTKVSDTIFLCGDYCDTASINGAMASGRRAAEAVVESLSES